MSNPAKTCIFCGQDCSARPRVKDAQGRYACKTCAENAAKPAPSPQRPAVETGPMLSVENLLGDLAPVELEIPLEPLPTSAPPKGPPHAADATPSPYAGMRTMNGCPQCGKPVKDEQVICLNCGTNLKSGKKTRVRIADRAEGEAPPPPTPARLGIAAAAAAIGALAATGLWIAVAQGTGYSSQVMVFLVGVCAAAPALVIVRGSGSRVTGAIAGAASLGAILLGLLLTPPDTDDGFDIIYGEGEYAETYAVLEPDESQAIIFRGAWIALGVLTSFSLGVTNPYEDEHDE